MSSFSENSIKFFGPLRVYYEDTDAGGVVYHANYLKYFERARTEWLRDLGFSQRKVAQDLHTAFVVRSMQLDFIKAAHLDDYLKVSTEVKPAGKVRFTFLQQILREEVDHNETMIGETLIATANSSVVCINTQTYKPRGLPSQVLQALEAIKHAD